jgi:hypothetical protein
VDEFGWKFIENGYLSRNLGPVPLMKDLVNELVVVMKGAVGRVLDNESVSSRKTRSRFT